VEIVSILSDSYSLEKNQGSGGVLQASKIKHGHVQALCMLISRLISVIS